MLGMFLAIVFSGLVFVYTGPQPIFVVLYLLSTLTVVPPTAVAFAKYDRKRAIFYGDEEDH
jgi:uncharacterized membrane protein YccC